MVQVVEYKLHPALLLLGQAQEFCYMASSCGRCKGLEASQVLGCYYPRRLGWPARNGCSGGNLHLPQVGEIFGEGEVLQICQAGLASNMGTFSTFLQMDFVSSSWESYCSCLSHFLRSKKVAVATDHLLHAIDILIWPPPQHEDTLSRMPSQPQAKQWIWWKWWF